MPRYKCRTSDRNPDEATEHSAESPARAAELFRLRYDAQALDYPEERDVIVRGPDGREVVYVVALRPVPEYTARRKKT